MKTNIKNNYWSQTENALVEQFYWAYTAATSASTRNQIFATLIPKFNYMINISINKKISTWRIEDKEDFFSETLMHIWTILSTKLRIDLLQGVLNFIWLSINNFTIDLIRKSMLKKKPDVIAYSKYVRGYNNGDTLFEGGEYNTSMQIDDKYGEDTINDHYDREHTITEILYELDNKIMAQKAVNRRNTLYLICLKDYLIENSFDGSGFKKYIMDRMQITAHNYWEINHLLGIKTSQFNIKKCKGGCV